MNYARKYEQIVHVCVKNIDEQIRTIITIFVYNK